MTKEKVPDLRFPKFENEWLSIEIKDIASKITDGTHDTPKQSENGIPYLTAIHIKDGFIDFANCYYLPESEHKKIYSRCNPEKGDLLMVNIGAGTANSALVKVEFEFSLKNVALIKPNRKKINPFFFGQVQRRNSAKLRHQISSGGAQPFLSLKAIGGLKLNIPPSLEEQQKIADFLSSVDQKIQQLRRKKELLEEYKKGVMQKLFPPADGQAPEIRFKDKNGEDFPDWEEYNVGKILKLFVTNSFSRNDLTYDSGKVKNIHYGDIHSKFKMGFKVNEETVPYIVKEKKLSKYDEEQYVKPGDLIVADASEDYVDIGKAIEVLETSDERILAGLHTIHARDKKPLTVVGFKGYLFRSESVRKQLKRVSQGASVLGISKGNFKEIYMNLPCLAEQQKIVEFLQNIDKNIALVESKIEKFQTFKKGLLQQMFV